MSRIWYWIEDRLPLRWAPDWLNNWLARQYWKRYDEQGKIS